MVAFPPPETDFNRRPGVLIFDAANCQCETCRRRRMTEDLAQIKSTVNSGWVLIFTAVIVQLFILAAMLCG